MIKFIFLISLALMVPQASQAESVQCSTSERKGAECGCELLQTGWKEIARCSGHQWSYIIEKDSLRRLCTGIAARGGHRETPCTPFTGELTEFKKCAQGDRIKKK